MSPMDQSRRIRERAIREYVLGDPIFARLSLGDHSWFIESHVSSVRQAEHHAYATELGNIIIYILQVSVYI